MTISSATIGTEWFLNGTSNLQQQMLETQRQLSSGFRVQDAADSPSQTAEIVDLGSTLAAVQNYQSKLVRVQVEASSADQTLGSAISLLDSARTLAAQAANTTATASDLKTISNQIQGIQQQLTSIANSKIEGRYIFGGNLDQTAPYSFDPTTGTITAATSTVSDRVITDPQNQAVYQALTAQQIFDPQDAAGASTGSSTFAALQGLQAALAAGSQSGIAASLTALQSASAWLNQQQAYYGQSEQRLSAEQNSAANQATALQTRIAAIRDTDVTQAATDLAQETTTQAAAMGAEAEIAQQRNLFSYLG